MIAWKRDNSFYCVAYSARVQLDHLQKCDKLGKNTFDAMLLLFAQRVTH